jgi:hypothetical protein
MPILDQEKMMSILSQQKMMSVEAILAPEYFDSKKEKINQFVTELKQIRESRDIGIEISELASNIERIALWKDANEVIRYLTEDCEHVVIPRRDLGDLTISIGSFIMIRKLLETDRAFKVLSYSYSSVSMLHKEMVDYLFDEIKAHPEDFIELAPKYTKILLQKGI